MWSVVACTVVGQRLQRPLHLLELPYLPVELGDVSRCKFLDRLAGPAAIVPKAQQLPDIFDREAMVTRLPHEAQRVYVCVGVRSVSRDCPFRWPQQAH